MNNSEIMPNHYQQLPTAHWLHSLQNPTITGEVKSTTDDFQVREILSFEPTGSGEHIYLWVEKNQLNTAYVGEQLAKFTQLPLRAVSYAGRKDKYAVAQQWFSIHAPGKQDFDWRQFDLPGCQILAINRHAKKLRIGAVRNNHFTITIRALRAINGDCQTTPITAAVADLAWRLQRIKTCGVPNYFGAQRFGERRHVAAGKVTITENGNLQLAQKLLQGETIRNRNKRSLAISALRAWLCNEFIHQRLLRTTTSQTAQSPLLPLAGDVLMLAGSHSFFTCTEIDEVINTRINNRDLLLTVPLWGAGELDSSQVARQHERRIGEQYPDICRCLAALGLTQERRSYWLYPSDLEWRFQGDQVTLEFSLPAGCFATSVIRELVMAPSAWEPSVQAEHTLLDETEIRPLL